MSGSAVVVSSWYLLLCGNPRRYQAENPLIALFRFPRPALGFALVAVVLWASSRALIPIDVVWPKGATHWRTPDFKLDVDAFYDFNITYSAHLPWATGNCLDNLWKARQPVDCGEPLSRVPVAIAVSTSDADGKSHADVKFTRFNDPLDRWYYKDNYKRTFGGFRGQAGRRYHLELDAKFPPDVIAKLRPHIQLGISSGWLEADMARLSFFYLGCVIAFVSSLVLVIGGWIEHCRRKPLPISAPSSKP